MMAGKAAPMNPLLAYGASWMLGSITWNTTTKVVASSDRHSQGSSVLTQLIAQQIDGKPMQDKLVSALLLGWNLAVPKGKDVGGAFKSIPLCHAVNQTGCVIVYASFRANSPPPANSLFGKVPGENMQAACRQPAAIGGGPGELNAYLSATIRGSDTTMWATNKEPIGTPFVKVPGLLTAECVASDAVRIWRSP